MSRNIKKIYSIRIKISIIYAAMIAALIISDVTYMIVCSLAAAYLHEIAHIFVMTLIKEPPKEISLRLSSSQIRDNGNTKHYFSDMAVHAAGPAINFLLYFVFINIAPLFGMVNLVLGAFNMMPVKHLDGGNLLLSFLCAVLKIDAALRIAAAVSWVAVIPVVLLGIIVFITSGYANFTLLIAAVYLIILNL